MSRIPSLVPVPGARRRNHRKSRGRGGRPIRIPLRVEPLEDRCLLANVGWIGADGGGDGTNWSDSRNWDTGTVPGAGDDVFIEVPNLIVENGFFTIHSLSSDAPLEITGGLTTSANSTCNGTVSIDGGGITSQGAFTFNNTVSLSGTLVDSGQVTMNDRFTWTAGAIYGGGTIQANGGINISGDASKTFNEGVINNAGYATWTGGPIKTVNGIWNNLAGSTFDAQADSQFLTTSTDGSAPMFNNAGTFIKSAGAGTSSSDALFNNTGIVDDESGGLIIICGTSTGTFEAQKGGLLELRTARGNTSAGTFVSTAGSTLDFVGYTLVAGAQVSGDGLVIASNLTLETDLTFHDLTVSGPLVLTGTQKVSGLLTFEKANVSTLKGQATATLRGDGKILINGPSSQFVNVIIENSGEATWSGKGGIGAAQAVWDNRPGSTFIAQSDGNTKGLTFSNEGTFQALGGPTTKVTTFSGAFNNWGTVEVQLGDLSITGAYIQTDGQTALEGHKLTATGGVDIEGGSLSGPGTIQGDLTNSGTITPGDEFDAGVLTVNGDYTQTAAGKLAISIAGATAGTQYDQLAISGQATLAGSLDVSLDGGFLPGLADVFRVVTFGGVVNPDHLPLDQLMQLNLPDPLVPMLRRGDLILVSSSSLLAPTGVDFDAVEDVAVANVVVATFTDQGSDDWTAGYQATIDWGDGDSSSASTADGTIVADPDVAHQFDVKVSKPRPYAEEGYDFLTVTVQRVGVDVTFVANNGSAEVADAPLEAKPPESMAPVAGHLFEGVVATFTDANPRATLSDFPLANIEIDWGDGTPKATAISIIQLGGIGTAFEVFGSHTYTKDGPTAAPLTVTIKDVGAEAKTGGGTATVSYPVTVLDAPLILKGLKVPNQTENTSASLKLATLRDTDTGGTLGDYGGTIDWGDDTSLTNLNASNFVPVSGSPGVFTIIGTHAYAEESAAGKPYTVTIQVYDNNGSRPPKDPANQHASTTTSIVVVDAPLTITMPAIKATAGTPTDGSLATFTDPGSDGTANDYSATIDWGDGSTSTATGADGTIAPSSGRGFEVKVHHAYLKAGNFTVTLTVSDVGGASSMATATATVADGTLKATGYNITAAEGIPLTNILVASFTDANPFAKSSDFTALIDWGDKSISVGIIQPDANVPGQFDVIGSKVYADEGSNTIKVTINAAGGSTATATGLAQVNDAPLTSQGRPIGAATGLTYSGIVATFVDANTAAKVADFTAMINWGDGPPIAGTITAEVTPGRFDVHGSHAFGSAGTFSVSITVHDVGGSSTQATSTAQVAGYAPNQVAHAYGFDQIKFTGPDGKTVAGDGTGQTIAIVDAYDDPNIAADLKVFDQQFGLPAPPSFTKVNQYGGSILPPENDGWAGEISLDVEWAHAMAPQANILLVEANSDNTLGDLLAAVDYAASQPGVVVVSMSFGLPENKDELSNDSHFTTPAGHVGGMKLPGGITFVASSGDSGKPPSYPAASPNVLAVGGTTLNLDGFGNILSETGWNESGGGISTVESQPPWQHGVVSQSTTRRTNPDVAYDADPATGFDVYNSNGGGGWSAVGGTSAGAPQWSALLAIVDQGLAVGGKGSLDGPTQTLPALYSLPSSDFHDITAGNNGYPAGPGYDLVTGRGSPVANNVVADLVNAYTLSATVSKVSAVEGRAFVGSLATFSVADPAGLTGSFTGTIDWGDGTTDLPDVTQGTIVPPSGNGVAFQLKGGHTYAEAGTYAIKVVIQDAAGHQAIATGQAIVADAPLTDTTPAPNNIIVSGVPNRGTGPVVLATFTDGNPGASASDFAVSATWTGAVPGSTSAFVQLVSTSATSSTWKVVGGATYAAPGTYPVTVTVSDVDLPSNAFTDKNTTITIRAPVPVLAPISPNPRNAPVSSVDVTFNEAIDLGSFATSALTLTVDGGPNLIAGAVTISPVTGTTYRIGGLSGMTAADGSYTLSLNANDIRDLAGNTGSGVVSATWLMDTTAPAASLSALPRRASSLSFPVTITGTDPGAHPSGVVSFTIYAATNGGAWTKWTTVAPTTTPGGTALATATFTGQSNTIYAFYAIATDQAGNLQAYRPSIEASTYVPNLTPPVTSISGGSYNNDGTFTLHLFGSDPGGGVLTYIQAWVAIDVLPPVPIGPAIPAATPSATGLSSATVRYVIPPGDYGPTHTYRFAIAGLDSAGNAEAPHFTPGQGNFSVAYSAPAAAQLAMTGLVVQHGAAERSFIRYVDLIFNDSDSGVLQSIIDSVNTPTAANPAELTLSRYNLGGGGAPVPVALQGRLALIDYAIEIDFGSSGLGGSPNTTVADGYYALTFAPAGAARPPGIGSTHHFDRLLGDATGDGLVDNNDLSAIAAEISLSSPTGYATLGSDVNGDGSVSPIDLMLTTRSKGRKLGSGLSLG